MDKVIEAALREGLGLDDTADVTAAACEVAAVVSAIADNPAALDLLASDPDRPMNQPAAVKVAAQYYYQRLADALSSTGEEQE